MKGASLPICPRTIAGGTAGRCACGKPSTPPRHIWAFGIVRAAPAAQVLGSEREGEADGSGREGLDCRGHERCIPDGTSSLTPKVTPRGIWSHPGGPRQWRSGSSGKEQELVRYVVLSRSLAQAVESAVKSGSTKA